MNWISVKEKLPSAVTNVLFIDMEDVDEDTYATYANLVMVGWCEGENKWYSESAQDLDIYTATHWMPLPGPPKEEKI